MVIVARLFTARGAKWSGRQHTNGDIGSKPVNWENLMLFGLGVVAIVGTIMWMIGISQRLETIERAVHFIVDNTNTVPEIRDVLRLIEGNTSNE